MGATHADERRGGPNIGKRSLQDDGEEGEVGHTDFKPKAGKTLADINGTR